MKLAAFGGIGLALALGSAVAHADERKMLGFEAEHVPGEIIVKFHDGLDAFAQTELLSALGGKVVHRYRASGAVRVKLDAAYARVASVAAADLASHPDVAYVEANGIVRIEKRPNDPRYGSLWGMTKISAERAWDVTTGSRNVVVGVIDTGVDHRHPDLAGNYWYNEGERGLDENGNDKATNGIDDDGNGYVDDFRGWDFANKDNDPMDDHNHGTHCAGTIGGQGNNGIGVAGVNWEVGLVGLKFISAAGSGTTADAIEAIEYATLMGFDMTSNSWGGGGYSEAMKLAIEEASEKGILFIAAAGNSRQNNDATPMYPANYDVPNVISVAATDENDRLASFSSYGAQTVHLAAPGVNILSSVRNSNYSQMSGTSMATPHVAGAAALIKARYPEATAAEIKARLLETVDPVTALNGRVATNGRLNVARALQ